MAAPANSTSTKPSASTGTSFGFGQSTTDTNPIKLVVYDFDQTLSSVHLYHELQGKRAAQLAKISDERLLEIFGGAKRLARLTEHLQRVSVKSELAIVSFGWVDVIKAALERMKLSNYFEHSVIIGNDSDELSEAKGNKATVIKRMRKERKLKSSQVIFVDDDMANISKAHSCCVTVAIQPRCGMSFDHMTDIEKQCLVYPEVKMELTTPKTVKKQVSKKYPEQENGGGVVDGLARFRIDPQKAALLDKDMDKHVMETPVIQIGGDGSPQNSDSEYELMVPILNNVEQDKDEEEEETPDVK